MGNSRPLENTNNDQNQQELLRIENVSFYYREIAPILKQFSLTVQRGEFVTLLGPSGCGKSTVLSLTAGFFRPTHGHIYFDGVEMQGINTKVGYMTQGDTLLPWRTVVGNVTLPLQLRRVPKDEIARKVDAYLELIHLSHARDFYPSQLSGGMKRRALLVRSLIYDPHMLLMDEPFAALDAQMRETLHKELLATVARLGEGVLFITHDISESILLADRVIVLAGPPLRILEEVQMPFGKDRDLDAVRASNEYLELDSHLRSLLKSAKSSGTSPAVRAAAV